MEPDWRDNILHRDADVRTLLERVRRVAVLGIKPESRSWKPAHYVPRYLRDAGFEVLPVPVYYPEAQAILGRPVYRRVAEVPPPVHLVDVFRRSEDLAAHTEDLLAAAPEGVWFQAGIRDDAVAELLARAGIRVVQDRCLMVEHRRLVAPRERSAARRGP